ncbi:hypothetical protein GK047_12105 [Paenibacillus sp. SYP-B3998]|uniref:GOLD domain-containing protein n=1 Tax=Paenibacillus sp. SYP-B3998 TaxID=2678564 RepID=A0A6G3ZZC6_9BACL|nr:hypothetical protein [Paenibacillus sp. SYP-B3998]NEW06757.1 hypothetical protein [Paenibacillus sp. SYP-B3998]
MMSRPIAVVVSSLSRLDEQWSRTSGNFSTKWFGSCKAMDVEVTVDGKIDNNITFSMAIDIENGNDVVKYNEVKNGSRLEYADSNTFYICNLNPHLSQSKNFKITLRPVV